MLGIDRPAARQVGQARKEFAELAAGWRMISARTAPGARAAAEAMIFNQMVLALEAQAGRREGAGVQELRLLAEGVRAGGVFPQDRATRWRPDASVTGYRPGDRIALSEEVFSRLADVVLNGVARAV